LTNTLILDGTTANRSSNGANNVHITLKDFDDFCKALVINILGIMPHGFESR
jgi:hypothetical protein